MKKYEVTKYSKKNWKYTSKKRKNIGEKKIKLKKSEKCPVKLRKMLVRPKKKVLTSVWLKNPENTQHSEKILHTNSEKKLGKILPRIPEAKLLFPTMIHR